MKTIWYQPLIEALRVHIEKTHMMEEDALKELEFTKEHLAYSSFGDDEKITIGCPWGIHCNCTWEIEAHVEFSLVRRRGP